MGVGCAPLARVVERRTSWRVLEVMGRVTGRLGREQTPRYCTPQRTPTHIGEVRSVSPAPDTNRQRVVRVEPVPSARSVALGSMGSAAGGALGSRRSEGRRRRAKKKARRAPSALTARAPATSGRVETHWTSVVARLGCAMLPRSSAGPLRARLVRCARPHAGGPMPAAAPGAEVCWPRSAMIPALTHAAASRAATPRRRGRRPARPAFGGHGARRVSHRIACAAFWAHAPRGGTRRARRRAREASRAAGGAPGPRTGSRYGGAN